MPAGAVNPFRADTQAVLAAASRQLNLAASLAGEARTAALDEFDRLNDRAEELVRLGLMWAEQLLDEVIDRLDEMVREEEARQSDILGTLLALFNRLRRETGRGPAPRRELERVPPTAPIPVPAPRPARPAAPIEVEPVVVAETVDVHARDTDFDKLHPVVREWVRKMIADLEAEDIPLRVFEACRAPERQGFLFAKGRDTAGRIVDRRQVVTFAKPWHSYHQYGLAVDMVIYRDGRWSWDDSTPETRAWWERYHAIARKHGLEPLSFETPHVQLAGTKASSLRAGEYPADGDAAWREALHAAIGRWPGSDKPPLAEAAERPSMAVMAVDWSGLPPVRPLDWHAHNGGQEWRVDDAGVYLRGIGNGLAPLRTDGAPLTCGRIVELYGSEIAAAARKHGVAPELLIMIIAAESSVLRPDDFTGPRSFVWDGDAVVHATGDPDLDGRETGDYKAGPMAIAADRARAINRSRNLGHDATELFAFFKNKPRSAPADLGLYRAGITLDVGAALIGQQIPVTGTDPILVAAAYSHGAIAASSTSVWHLMAAGDYLDRAASWFGDACEVLKALGR